MKICVFSDFHGNLPAVKRALQIVQQLHPDKVVICGDYFGGWTSNERQVGETITEMGKNSVLYLVRGNNDYRTDDVLLPTPPEDNAVMYHFGRTLYFTHGDRYNIWRIPPVLQKGDVLVHGHTHIGIVKRCNGIIVANVGSMGLPRDDVANFMVLDDSGITLYDTELNPLQILHW